MDRLARVDLERLRIDSESFLGQALVLGRQFEKLPENAPEALLGYLRVVGTSFARRFRTGIGVSRDGLERGVRQAVVSLELGLEDAAGGDLNAAVDLLAQGKFEDLRKRGREIAFFRLEEMREGCRALAERPGARFLQDPLREVRRWAQVVPETWMRPPEEGEEGEQPVDPLEAYAAFRTICARADFLEALPGEALDALGRASPGAAFGEVLRNLVLSLAMDLERLVPEPEEVAAFRKQCFAEKRLRPEVRKKVVGLVRRQLEAVVEAEEIRQGLAAEVAAEIGILESGSGGPMEGFFVMAGRA